jgi:hypothetical protein
MGNNMPIKLPKVTITIGIGEGSPIERTHVVRQDSIPYNKPNKNHKNTNLLANNMQPSKIFRCYWCGVENPTHIAIKCPAINKSDKNSQELICPRPNFGSGTSCGTVLRAHKTNPNIVHCVRRGCPAYQE